MSFLAPYMLWGALAAGVPIALHFFFRSRHRVVPWAAMKFLLASLEQTSRRLRFQELLLLLVRMAVLVLLALALARPTNQLFRTGGDAVDAVLVVDTSLSMQARAGAAPPAGGSDPYLAHLGELAGRDGAVTRFDRARAAALAVLDHLPAYSTVQVITVNDRASVAGPANPGDLDQARALLRGLRATDQGTDLLPGLAEAAAALERGPSPNKELYLFSDLQKRGFEARQDEVLTRLREINQTAAIHLVGCSTQEPANVAITDITAQSSVQAGERADFAVLLRNSSPAPVRSLTVSLEVDGKSAERDSRSVDELRPGETRAALLTGLLERPGRHLLHAQVQSDDLPADNHLDQVLRVHDQVRVLLIDGTPNELDPRASAAYYLRFALQPFPVQVVSAAQATPRDLAGQELCLLVNVPLEPQPGSTGGSLAPEMIEALTSFVHDGHGLMIFAGDRVEPEAYNRLLHEQQQLLPVPILRVERRPQDEPRFLDRQSAASPYLRFRDERSFAGIDSVRVHQYLVLQEPGPEKDAARVLLRYRSGEPALVSHKRPGAGEVLVFSTSANDEHWTDWYYRPSFVPFLLVSAQHLLDVQPQAYNLVAGEPLRWEPPTSSTEGLFDLLAPDGERQPLGHPERVAGRPLLTALETSHAGIYRMVRRSSPEERRAEAGTESEDTQEAVPFAVVPDLRESEDLQILPVEEIQRLAGFSLRYQQAGNEAGAFTGIERLHNEWTLWLLAGLLVLVLTESALAWYCGRAR